MKVTIDGITYEGTPSEIRDIVENPPHLSQKNKNMQKEWINIPFEWPDSFPEYLNINYPHTQQPNIPTYPNWPATSAWQEWRFNC